jgi:hypothetical protein
MDSERKSHAEGTVAVWNKLDFLDKLLVVIAFKIANAACC